MKPRHRLILLAAVFCYAAPSAAVAQTIRFDTPPPPAPRVSHVPIPSGIEPGLADEFLNGRVRQAETAAQMERILTELAAHPEKLDIKEKDRALLRKAAAKAGGRPEEMLHDPEVRRIITEAAGRSEKLPELSPDEKARLEEFARGLVPPSGSNPPNASPPTPTPGKPEVTPPGNATETPKPQEGPAPAPSPNGSGAGPLAPPLSPPAPEKSPVKDRFRDLAETLADKGLSESPAFRHMLANLDRVKAPQGSGFGRWERQFQGFEDHFAQLGMRLPKVSLPRGDFSPRGPAPRFAGGGTASQEVFGDGAGLAVLLVLGIATAGLVAWALLRRRGLIVGSRAGGGQRLGPWPVRPESVHTRDDLVRAFEYLALLLLGPAARSRNHREIAAGLGADGAARRAAAERLAGLYEQARYAPPEEALPGAELAAARADLSLLAGAAAP